MPQPDARIGLRTNIVDDVEINPNDEFHVPVGKTRYYILYPYLSIVLVVSLTAFIIIPVGLPLEKVFVFFTTVLAIFSIITILGLHPHFIIRKRGSIVVGRNRGFPLFPAGKTPMKMIFSKPWVLKYMELSLMTVQLYDGSRYTYADIGIYPDSLCKDILESGTNRFISSPSPELRIYSSDRDLLEEGRSDRKRKKEETPGSTPFLGRAR
jgi:hypothetical protein